MRNLLGVLLAAAVLSFDSARGAHAPSGDEQRFESIVATCGAAGAEATAQSLIGSSSDAIDWIVRVRLGLTATTAEWDECAQAATALALRSRSSLARSALAAHMTVENGAPPLARALAILADLGEPRDLAKLVEWSTQLDAAGATKAAARSRSEADEEEDWDLNSRGAVALRGAVARLANLAADDEQAWKQSVDRAQPALAIAIVRGLADSDHPAAVARLAELFPSHKVASSLLLAELSRAARRTDREHDEAARAAVRPLLDSSDVDELRDAALCIGALGDDRSAPTLARLLDHANAGVRANAAWSLSRLTARRIGPASPNWSKWLEAEAKWWRESAPGELQRLSCNDPRLRAEAARELSLRRYPRHELAMEIARALPLDDVSTATVACGALQQLKSASAVEVLERRLANEPAGAARKLVAETAASLAATRVSTRAEVSKR